MQRNQAAPETKHSQNGTEKKSRTSGASCDTPGLLRWYTQMMGESWDWVYRSPCGV